MFWKRYTKAGRSRSVDQSEFGIPLLRLSEQDILRLCEACEGTLILGDTGSGKSSSFYVQLLTALLRHALAGGLLLTVKPTDLQDIERIAAQAGRSKDLVVFGPGQTWRFNFLDYELNRSGTGGGQVENVVQLLQVAAELADQKSGQVSGRGEKYWDNARQQLLRAAITVIQIAGKRLDIALLSEFINSAPQSPEEASDHRWRECSPCYQLLCAADDVLKNDEQDHDFTQSMLFFMREWPAMDTKLRTSIQSTVSVLVDTFNRGTIRTLFCTETNITPEASLEGKLIVLNLPIKEWHDVGRIIQGVFKYLWQRAMERRNCQQNNRPVVLCVDECQNFLTSHDALFQSTARSSKVCTICLTQNLPALYATVPGDEGRHHIDSWIGNLRTKVFHAQSDPSTCRWQSDLIGRTRQFLMNGGHSHHRDLWDQFWGTGQRTDNFGFSETYEYEVQPNQWSQLRTGGVRHNLLVDAVIYQAGRVFTASGKTYLKTTMAQGHSP